MASRDYSEPHGFGSRVEDYWMCPCGSWVPASRNLCVECGTWLGGGLYGEEGIDFIDDEAPWDEDGQDNWIV